MPLSSNSLFHFTKSKDSLFGILKDNFKISACKETVTYSKSENIFYVPMVSFCDIPLSQIKEHISKYGEYGIGLTKDWGMKNKLNPVLYLSQGSNVSESLVKSIINFTQNGVDGKGMNAFDITDEQAHLCDIARYVKNYEGTLVRGGDVYSNYRYSDEREWRYVPPIENSRLLLPISEEVYNSDDNASHYNQNLKDLRLEYSPNDIRYIIIRNDEEISEFIKFLGEAKGKRYSSGDVKRLTTRILTCEQIKNDI